MSVIDEYLANVSAPQKAELERIRAIVKQTVPETEEVISYGMPGFKYKKKYLMGFAAFKDHLSLFPTATPIEAIKEKLSNFQLSKGTIQFTIDNPIPESIIQELVAVRIDAINN
jgi:uncharacterized protein YdhG (YjbR/CyaY superfamily)